MTNTELCLNITMAAESGKDVDREMLDWVKTNPNSVRTAFDKLLASNNDLFVGALKGLREVTQQKGLESNRPGKSPIQIRDYRNFYEVIEIIYRVRCNLFHGAKKPDVKRDMMLIKYSTEFLLKLIGLIRFQGRHLSAEDRLRLQRQMSGS